MDNFLSQLNSPPETPLWDMIILGAGAAGLMCGRVAAMYGKSVLILDHSETIGRKISISGGGRCNFTNINASPAQYLSENPNFCKSALARFTPADFISLVEQYRISYYEKKLGQLFCTHSAKDIIHLLLQECALSGCFLLPSTTLQHIEKNDHFRITTNRGNYESRQLVLATGGLSIPKIGATDFSYRIARQFGHSITPLRPGLVGLTLDSARYPGLTELSGIAFDSITSSPTPRSPRFQENTLITHRGLSGPAILQISSFWNPEQPIYIDCLPGKAEMDILLSTPHLTLFDWLLAQNFPQRLAHWFAAPFPSDTPIAQIKKTTLQAFWQHLKAWEIHPVSTDGYRKAEVTVGGINTRELSSKTMESRILPGLFCIGEAVDVTGWLGGYNFQWAWASGHAAGSA